MMNLTELLTLQGEVGGGGVGGVSFDFQRK